MDGWAGKWGSVLGSQKLEHLISLRANFGKYAITPIFFQILDFMHGTIMQGVNVRRAWGAACWRGDEKDSGMGLLVRDIK